MRDITGLVWMNSKVHYCYDHMAFWHGCSQKELEEGVFTNQKICGVVVLGLSQFVYYKKKISPFLWMQVFVNSAISQVSWFIIFSCFFLCICLIFNLVERWKQYRWKCKDYLSELREFCEEQCKFWIYKFR